MKFFALAFTLCCLVANTAIAGTLSAAEADGLRKDIAFITTAFERGDAEPIIERTHHSLKELAGGAEAYATLTRQAVEHLRESGIRTVSVELGAPTRTYAAGEEEVCFVPRVTVMEIEGKRLRSTTFLIAIRKEGGADWTYLDGNGLRKNPELLYQLLPALEPGVPLPPNTFEPVESEERS